MTQGNYTSKHRFGWRKDPHSVRDFRRARPVGLERVEQRRMDHLCQPILDQGQSSECVGHGVAAGIELAYAVAGRSIGQFSPWYAGWEARAVDGFQLEDNGAYPRSGLYAAQHRGICQLSEYPRPADVTMRPPQRAENGAIKYADFKYERVAGGSQGALDALQQDRPIIIGVGVTVAFDVADGRSVIPTPKPGDRILGGHCFLLVGFDRFGARIRARNSWGTSWADGGYCWLEPGWCDADGGYDLWAITAVAPEAEAA